MARSNRCDDGTDRDGHGVTAIIRTPVFKRATSRQRLNGTEQKPDLIAGLQVNKHSTIDQPMNVPVHQCTGAVCKPETLPCPPTRRLY